MATLPRYALARSYLLTSTLDALVTDAGGALRTATIIATGLYVRARLAPVSGAGASTDDPIELLTRVSLQLSAGAGGGSYDVTQRADGRVQITWSGPGSATIFTGALTRALGFASGPTISAGGTATSDYPPLGFVQWALSERDSDWTPSITGAASQDEAGRVYRRGGALVRWSRSLTALWVPRVWSDNASGEYFSPAWWGETAFAGTSSATAPNPHTLSAARAESWVDTLYSIDGEVAFGFTDELQSLTVNSPVSTVYVAPSVYDEPPFATPERAATYRARRSVALQLERTGTVEIPA